MARNLQALLPLVARVRPEPDRLLHRRPRPRGHRRRTGTSTGWCARRSRSGSTPEDALVMASFHPAQWHGLDDLGAVAPGYQADLLAPARSRAGSCPTLVLKRGRPVEDVALAARARVGAPDRAREARHAPPTSRSRRTAPTIRAIGLIEDQVVTESLEREPVVVDGHASPTPMRASPRSPSSSATSPPAASGSGSSRARASTRGALASSVAHDAHNLVVVGMSDDDLAFAVSHLAEIGGGIVVVDDGRVVAECPLPVAGLLSDAPLADGDRAEPRHQRGRARRSAGRARRRS